MWYAHEDPETRIEEKDIPKQQLSKDASFRLPQKQCVYMVRIKKNIQ